MFGFIKKMFGGIFAFLGGLLKGKKSQEDTSTAPKAKKGKGYFLELDETGSTKPAEAKKAELVKAASTTEDKKPEPVQAAVATAPAPAPKAETAAPAKKPEPAKAKAESKNGKVKIEAQPNPPATNNGKVEPQSDLKTFAPNYLLPTTSNSRRRPGPSLDMFRDMARQVKTPG